MNCAMTKEQVVRGIIGMIERVARDKGITPRCVGVGSGYSGTIWEGLFKDDSGIPKVYAQGDGFSIELRPFWGNPEVDVRRAVDGGEDLIVLNWSDRVKRPDNGEYVSTGLFRLNEVRVDSRGRCRECIEEAYGMADEVERYALKEV